MSKHYRDVLPQHVALQIRNAFEKLKYGEKTYQFDYSLKFEHTTKWYNAKTSVLENKNGDFLGITIVITPVY